MSNAPVVIAAAICALVLIYFLPRFDEAGRKVYGRWRKRQRDQREEKLRRERMEAQRSSRQ
jgi:hypothetical protein